MVDEGCWLPAYLCEQVGGGGALLLQGVRRVSGLWCHSCSHLLTKPAWKSSLSLSCCLMLTMRVPFVADAGHRSRGRGYRGSRPRGRS